MKIYQSLILTFLSALLIQSSGQAKPGGGGTDMGGGDFIRADFLQRGNAVIDYLKNSTSGKTLVSENKLNLERLKKSLDVNIIKVSENTLVDRTGSVVDALGSPKSIILNKQSWALFAENDLDSYFLVFHEMLRENGIEDDNYVISKKITPFSDLYKVKQLFTLRKPLIAEDSLINVVQKDRITYGGTGCPSDSSKNLTRFDSVNNTFEIFPADMTVTVGANLKSFERQVCLIAIPFKASAGQKLIVTQVDFAGEFDLKNQKTANVLFSVFQAGDDAEINAKIISTQKNSISAGFLLRENKRIETSCGGEGIIRVNSEIRIQELTKPSDKLASTVKSGKVAIYFKSIPCQ